MRLSLRRLRDGVFPAALLADSSSFRDHCVGVDPPHGIWAHICGTDLVRDRDGTVYVLEDNLRVPSGLSYLLENRLVVKPANESGGYGMLVGPTSTRKQREETAARIRKDPRNFVAQPVVTLSTVHEPRSGPSIPERRPDAGASRHDDANNRRLLGDAPSGSDGAAAVRKIQWIGVLKSLSTYQMYRQKMQVRVRRADDLKFLLTDPDFPRSVFHCVSAVEQGVRQQPRNESARHSLTRLKRYSQQADVAALAGDNVQLHDFIDRLQVCFGRVHDAISTTYFLAAAPVDLARSA